MTQADLRPLLDLFARYGLLYPDEQEVVRRFRQLVEGAPDCLSRRALPGHLTASAWILSPDGGDCLLVHHKKLDKWLQPGGHVAGERELHRAALREAREETGIAVFDLLRRDGLLVPLDLDMHPIPAAGGQPAHLHYDVRFLLRAGAGQEPLASDESHAVEWVPRRLLGERTDEESVLRLDRKASAWLAASS